MNNSRLLPFCRVYFKPCYEDTLKGGIMYDFISYLYYKAKAKYYLMKANSVLIYYDILKYYDSLPYRRIALNYEMRAYAIKHRQTKKL